MSGTENEGLDALRERMRAEGVRYVQIEVPELDGGLRCKLLALDKGLSDGIGWSNIIYGLTAADDVYESPFSSYENGFADVFGTPDAATASTCRSPARAACAAPAGPARAWAPAPGPGCGPPSDRAAPASAAGTRPSCRSRCGPE